MTGLGDLFDEAEGRAAREAADATLAGDELGAVHARVRRAHARRSAFQASLVAIAVVVAGFGFAYGVTRGAAPAADVPGPSAAASPSPSTTPSPSPSETGLAWPGFTGSLTVDPHVPEASIITREAWASAGPGWVLVSYREAWTAGDVDDRGPQVIYLASPQGDRYELVNVPGDTVSVLAWEAGTTTAAVSVQPEGDPPFAAMLNLVTGEVTPIEGYAPYIWSVAFLDSAGVPVWRGNDATSAYMRIAPDGIQKDYKIPAELGAAELAKATLGAASCGRIAPYDEASVLVVCGGSDYPDLGTKYVARVSPDTGEVDVLYQTDGENGVGLPFRGGDDVVAPLGGVDCAADLAVVDGGTPTPVPGADADLHPNATITMPFGAVGDELVWGVTSGCSGDSSPVVVVASDLAAGTYSVLMPHVPGPDGEYPYQTVTGVAVAH